MQIVVRAGVLAVDVHQVILGGRRVTGVHRRQRAVLVLQYQACHIGIVARQYQLRGAAADRDDRAHQVGEHVDVVNADLQHHAARHAGSLITPRGKIDFAETVAADVAFRIHQFAEYAGVDLLPDPAKVPFTAALITHAQHHAGLAAGVSQRTAVGNGVGNRLVEKHMLAGLRGGDGGFAVHAVGRGVDDGVYVAVGEDRVVRGRCGARILPGKHIALVLRTRVARYDVDGVGALDCIGKHVRPPAHAQAGDVDRFE